MFGHHIEWVSITMSNLHNVNLSKGYQGTSPSTIKVDMRLHADSLELSYDLIYTYKVLFGLVNGAGNDLFTLTSLIHSTSTRGHTYKLFPHCNRVDLYKYFFSQRIIDTWNSLPAKPNDFSSIARFTRFIRSVELPKFLANVNSHSRSLYVSPFRLSSVWRLSVCNVCAPYSSG